MSNLSETKKLTKKRVEAAQPKESDYLLHDCDIRGFRCKVTPKGKKVYYLYYRTAEGKQRNPAIGRHGDITCEQAREIAKQWQADVAKGLDPSHTRKSLRQSITVKELWLAYFEARKHHIKESSARELKRLWEKNILPDLGNHKALQVNIDTVRRFHEKNAHRPYSANRMLEAVRSAYNYALQNELLPLAKNPCSGVKKFKEKKRERFLSLEELARLQDILNEAERSGSENYSVIALIRLLLLTGCRLDEILSLKWQYVDFGQHCLRLPDSKTGAKIVYLSKQAINVLSDLNKVSGNPYVITGKVKGKHLAPPQKAWQRIRKKAGIEDVRLHDLRHSFASVGVSNGLTLSLIGGLLGQSQSHTTERYAHLAGDPLKQAADLIGDAIMGKS